MRSGDADDADGDDVLFSDAASGACIPTSVRSGYLHAAFGFDRVVPAPWFSVKLIPLDAIGTPIAPPFPTTDVAPPPAANGIDRVDDDANSERSDDGTPWWMSISRVSIDGALAIAGALRGLVGAPVSPAAFLSLRAEGGSASDGADVADRLLDVPPCSVLCAVVAAAQRCGGLLRAWGGLRSPMEVVCCCFDAFTASLKVPPSAFTAVLSAREVVPRVVQVSTASCLVLASSFVRFQEHYESESPVFRGQHFSREAYRAWCRDAGRAWDYYLRWPGFNIPYATVLWCAGELPDGLAPQEAALLRAVADVVERGGGAASEWYVVGTSADRDDAAGTLCHEVAHGLFFTNAGYREAVRAHLTGLPPSIVAALHAQLRGLGYCDDVDILEDETQAYLVSGGLHPFAEGRPTDDVRSAVATVTAALKQTWATHTGMAVPDSART